MLSLGWQLCWLVSGRRAGRALLVEGYGGVGLIVRALDNYHLPDALRLTVGPAEANELVVQALKEFMAT